MKLILKDKNEVAEGTMSFSFTPETPLKFTPGQFGDFTIEDPPRTDAKGNTRTFSFASSPANARVTIATRMRDSAFKECLRTAPAGTPVSLAGPMGSFTLHADRKRPAVFLTGGIGITPVRSIVEDATQRALAHEIFVFYSNRSRASTAFLHDFEEWGRTNSNLHFVPTLTDERPGGWDGELGSIDGPMLRRHIIDITRPVYYVVGPPGMVAAMQELLAASGIDELQIRTEDFAGYWGLAGTTTVLFADQNVPFALRHAQRGHILEKGRVVHAGASEAIRNDPDVQGRYLAVA